MAKRKGIIQVAEEEVAKFQGILEEEYEKSRECAREQQRCEIKLNDPSEELTTDERMALEKEVLDLYEKSKAHVKRAMSIKSDELHQANYRLDSAKDRIKKTRAHVADLQQDQKIDEKGLAELERKYLARLEVFKRDIEHRRDNLKHAQKELDELEGD